MFVRTFNNLTTSKSFNISEIEEPLKSVVEVPEDHLESYSKELIDVEVAAVTSISKTHVCLCCKGIVQTMNVAHARGQMFI